MAASLRLRWFTLCFIPICSAMALAQTPEQTEALSHGGQFQIGKVPRAGFDLYYRTLGEGEPVLLLSGGPGNDCDYMTAVAEQVAKFGRAILLEQRGTGRSLPPIVDKDTITLALYLEDLEALRKHLNVERWILVGHSAGGLLAMYYAAANSARVDKLVLVDTAPIASEFLRPFDDNMLDRLSTEERNRLATLQKSSAPEARSEIAQLQVGALFFDREVGTRVAAAIGNAWHPAIGRLLGGEMTPPGYDLRGRLKDFDRPVLILNGRQDPMDPLMAYETSVAFKQSTLKFIERAGHFPWMEQEREFDDVLGAFLK